jgi:hypothetical protein
MWHINLPTITLTPTPTSRCDTDLTRPSNTFKEVRHSINAPTGNYINLAIVHSPLNLCNIPRHMQVTELAVPFALLLHPPACATSNTGAIFA